ncbi:MAG: PD-(D/E)XK nuclease family protein, partial [Clostridia bacterium]|nr:PD-(D/E)XK nuclease family protein [Clostridia bacterium]
KLTVTGLLREIQSPDEQEPLIERPAFLTEDPGHMTGAERGTAYHRAMQCLNLSELASLSGRALTVQVAAQLDALLETGRISLPQREAVYPGKIARFLESETGRRLLRSIEVQREWPFNVMVRISEALEADEANGYGDEEILVQGTIDCCFMEDGHWILLDYKTDRNTDAQALTLRYRNQLRLYALALEKITGVSVGEIRLCLLQAGEVLEIPLNPAAENSVPW